MSRSLQSFKPRLLRFAFSLFAVSFFLFSSSFPLYASSNSHEQAAEELHFPLPLASYEAQESIQSADLGRPLSLSETLAHRIKEDPFNLVTAIIFFLAVIHTFLCAKFTKLSHHFDELHQARLATLGKSYPPGRRPVSFLASLFHFLGEVEVVFGLWLVPLAIFLTLAPHHGWNDVLAYIDTRNFTEPMFVVIIMVIASSRPIIDFSRTCLRQLARIGHESPLAWWLAILIITPLLGSFITEPAAMTIGALLLAQQFYKFQPSTRLKYATLGLLFVGVSVGGTLTHFAAPPILMVARTWQWDTLFVLATFGWRAALGILTSVGIYFFIFRKELFSLKNNSPSPNESVSDEFDDSIRVPLWVIFVHILFLAWTVMNLHHPALFVIGFLFYLAFTRATSHHQNHLSLRSPVLVGFFLAALIIHGGLQGWWISPVLAGLGEVPLFFTGVILTAFNDNAAITYLASQVPAFNPEHLVNGVMVSKEGAELVTAHALQYAIVAGAVTGGGLTVIANAPNPAGQSLLAKCFKNSSISPAGLFLGAFIPTAIMVLYFIFLPH